MPVRDENKIKRQNKIERIILGKWFGNENRKYQYQNMNISSASASASLRLSYGQNSKIQTQQMHRSDRGIKFSTQSSMFQMIQSTITQLRTKRPTGR